MYITKLQPKPLLNIFHFCWPPFAGTFSGIVRLHKRVPQGLWPNKVSQEFLAVFHSALFPLTAAGRSSSSCCRSAISYDSLGAACWRPVWNLCTPLANCIINSTRNLLSRIYPSELLHSFEPHLMNVKESVKIAEWYSLANGIIELKNPNACPLRHTIVS